jgi:hypothetical protein
MPDPQTVLATTARRLLLALSPPIDRVEINRRVKSSAAFLETQLNHIFSEDDLENTVRELETLFVVQQGEAFALSGETRPPNWYIGERRKPGKLLRRYLQKLSEDGWPEPSVRELENSTARVVEALDDPARAGPWDWRGLVVGDVQSGKTAHYAGVINRAADAGYRIIVVLAGMHKILRLQTQKRLDSDFLGWSTNRVAPGSGGRKPIGVAEFDRDPIVDSLTMATPAGDFSLQVAQQSNFTPQDHPFLLVVKKNARILDNLNGWAENLPQIARSSPLLVIDDEADQASVDTGEQDTLTDGSFDEDYDPKRINGAIRRLLKTFSRSAYVAYTATPFANILMHDERRAKEYGADLFPAAFIVSLSPPDDYFGPVAVFGTLDSGETGLPIVRTVDQVAEAWLPSAHRSAEKPRYEGREEIPPSLKQAIDTFLLSCAARAARGKRNAHNSMLIHVSRFVDVHRVVHSQVQQHFDNVRALITGGDRQTLQRLEYLWRSDFEPTTAAIRSTVFGRGIDPVDWAKVAAELFTSAEGIQIRITNGESTSDLDYDAYKETGLSVIAIGGDKLSRGLTLEGLTVSYFLRTSRQYDSLLQMGRWFGYRRGFADVCRLFTTADLEDWFRHIATANQEFRSQLAHMAVMGATPKQYGLRVEDHSILSVTASNKQRYAQKRQVSFSGEGKIQTVMFRDRNIIKANAESAANFLTALGTGEQNPRRPGGNRKASGELWRGVSGSSVIALLRNLKFPPESITVEGRQLADYIQTQMAEGELTEWTVFLAEGDGSEAMLAGRRLNCVQRARKDAEADSDRYTVQTSLNPDDQAVDLTDAEFQKALAETNFELAKPTDRPSGPAIRRVRGERPERGLLIIYPLDRKSAHLEEDGGPPVVSVVLSFPESATARSRTYVQNRVAEQEEKE